MSDSLSWYLRRFVAVVEESDLWKTIGPIMQPAMATIGALVWTGERVSSQPLQEANNALAVSQTVIGNPQRVVGYLVTTEEPAAVATAKYLWGSAQQSGLTIGGIIFNQGANDPVVGLEFAPLAITAIPTRIGNDWQPLLDAMPDFSQAIDARTNLTSIKGLYNKLTGYSLLLGDSTSLPEALEKMEANLETTSDKFVNSNTLKGIKYEPTN